MQTRRRTVVYIEDEPGMIELMDLILRRHGLEFIGATDGEAGLQAIRRAKPDIVLLDLMLPGMDGWEVYRQIRADADLRDTPVAVVTARSSPIDKVLALHIARVQEYITKPFSLHELTDSLARYVGPLD